MSTEGEGEAPGEVTRILADLQGEQRDEALERLVDVVYDELRALARTRLRHQRPDHSLTATALSHEAYLRLMGSDGPSWRDRRHFFRAAARAMRHILIDHARRRGRIKRGGSRVRVSLSNLDLATESDPEEILALDEALRRLEERDPRAADVVHLRFFAGLSVRETADALEISERTVKREWAFARAWLYGVLRDVDD